MTNDWFSVPVLRVQQGISGEATVTKEENGRPDTTTATATTTTSVTSTTSSDTDAATTTTTTTATDQQQTEQVTLLQQQLAEMTHARDYYYYEMYKKDTELTTLVSSFFLSLFNRIHTTLSSVPFSPFHVRQIHVKNHFLTRCFILSILI